MQEILEIESILNACKSVYTSPIITESYRKKTTEKLKTLLKTTQELFVNGNIEITEGFKKQCNI